MEYPSAESLAQQRKRRRSRILGGLVGVAIGGTVGSGIGNVIGDARHHSEEQRVLSPEDIFSDTIPCEIDNTTMELQLNGEAVVLVDGRCNGNRVAETPLNAVDVREEPSIESHSAGAIVTGRFVLAICTEDVYVPPPPWPNDDTVVQARAYGHFPWVKIQEDQTQGYILATQVIGESALPECDDVVGYPSIV